MRQFGLALLAGLDMPFKNQCLVIREAPIQVILHLSIRHMLIRHNSSD
jgi:hypothetical protein